MALIQVRVDDELKTKASKIYEELGLDLSSAIRMFLKRTIENNGIPFPMVLNEEINNHMDALKILAECQRISSENGNSKMSLEEINEEIKKARQERKRGCSKT